MVPFPSPLLTVGSGAAAAPLSSKWRINITLNNSEGGLNPCSIAELEMRATAGGADQCNGGTASASNVNGTNSADKAFANDGTTTFWSTTNAAPQWLEYDFAAPVTVYELSITARSAGNHREAPATFDVQYFDGSTWRTYWSAITGPFGVGETRVINKDTPTPIKKFWRVKATATQSTATISSSELQWRTSPGGSNVATGGVGSAGAINASFPPVNAYDGNNATFFVSGSTLPQTIGYGFTSEVDIVEISYRNRPDAFGVNESLKDFTIQYGTNAGWTDAWSVTGEPAWTAGETRVYTKP
jgi:hypothetical protein